MAVMLKSLLVATLGVAVVIGAIVSIKFDQFSTMGEAAKNMLPPAVTVTAMTVAEAHWEQTLPATGSVSAVQGVMVSAELGGRVTRIGFESGANVAAGKVLLQLDTASEQAQLAAAEASAALARADVARVRELGRNNLVSREAVDSAEARFKQSAAQVDNVAAMIAKKTVRAPFAGRLGLRRVNLGQVLSEGAAIVSLQTLDPIQVDFSLPQQQLPRLTPGLSVRVSTDAAPGESLSGEIIAIEPEVDPATRSVRVRARVANPDETLHAGMFAQVEVVLPGRRPVRPIVQSAVRYAPYGDSVFVVERRENAQTGEVERVLRQRFVRLGQARGDFVDVVDGLAAGETVVTSGVFKLQDGMRVIIDNALAPTAELAPQPAES